MRILLLVHSFNSLTQALFVALRAAGHTVSVELDIADSVAAEAVALFRPDLILAPFLKRAIGAAIWRRYLCLVVHPGVAGDRGPSSLDRAILDGEAQWGVTVLQADAEMDAGPVWGEARFPMRAASKSSLYRKEVCAAALLAVAQALERLVAGAGPLTAQPARAPLRPLLRQPERRIDWQADSTALVLAKLRSADGVPGVLDSLFGQPCYLSDAHAATPASLALVGGAAGDVVARRDDAVLRRTVDGGVWIGHARRAAAAGQAGPAPFKLALAHCFAADFRALPELAVPTRRASAEWAALRYWEDGGAGFLSFDFHNGAMSTEQCQRLAQAVREARLRPIRVLVLLGGEDFFSNGIHLNRIEASESPADESWRNINAMNDLALDILSATDQLTVSALRGNAGAGGAFLALAADLVWACEPVLLNPHYKNMGNLYGSEYWTYSLPRRVGAEAARALMQNRLPWSAGAALAAGLVDALLPAGLAALEQRAIALARDPAFAARLAEKRARRARDEAHKPLQSYRDEELARMHRNFYGFDPSYHVARFHFVHKMPHAWTPRHLAVHRNPVLKAPPTTYE
ncbi:MAG: enoyl-CoA hydratase-related protein [Pseudomonadota bacterium]|nr:enoyl-CoA hydratase-related protein [Pseudomonadota bacterium]